MGKVDGIASVVNRQQADRLARVIYCFLVVATHEGCVGFEQFLNAQGWIQNSDDQLAKHAGTRLRELLRRVKERFEELRRHRERTLWA